MAHGPLVGVGSSATLQDAATAMHAHDVSCVLVGGGPALLTERDLARAYRLGLGHTSPVTAVETMEPLTTTTDVTLLTAARLMLQHHVRHLVVLGSQGEVLAVVSLRAASRILARSTDPAAWSCLLDAAEQL
jgi:CBS domain-containing protein